jgi:hypothetical protein
LGDFAFESCTGLTSITLPGSLTDLGVACFAGCSGLASAALPAGLTDLQNSVFSDCSSLITITIPNSVTNIGVQAFAACGSLTNVIIGNGVLNIGSQAFWNCTNLSTVAIPAGTLSIDMSAFQNGAFGGCTGLSAINVDPLNSAYSSVEGVLFNKDQSELFIYPQARPGNYYVVPDSVIDVGDSAFLNCSNLTDITIGNNVADIANWAFFGCSGLTKITIPDSVTNIENAPVCCMGAGVVGGVFYGCTSLTNVIVGKGLLYLGLGTFSGCTNLLNEYFKGDAPTPGTSPLYVDVFGSDDPTTVYYLPGTTGWGSTYADRPAVLWNPQIETGDASFGVRLNGLGFNITGTADIPVVIEACTNRVAGSWVPLQSCTVTNGLVYFGDPQWGNYPNRFYRIRSP